MKNIKHSLFTIITLLAPSILYCSCSEISSGNQVQTYASVQVIATSLQELFNRSEIIVTGKAIEMVDTMNMARDIYDPSKPDKDLFIIGQIYKINVIEYIKGNGPGVIFVVQDEGMVRNNTKPSPAEIAHAKEMYDYRPMNLGKEYLFYLRNTLGGKDDTYFSGTSQPWKFVIQEQERIKPETTWNEAEKFFPEISLEDAISIMNSPINLISSPYPVPVTPYP